MEKIKVNMTPCEEVKTIHASQNDNATRKWAFDLYDENGKIDSSSIKEQMIFDSRVGGTEQILPENTSVPTTSPIIADIQYPDSLRSEQTFLYRESPTTVNGQSKITRIKGNTLVWNQLLWNGNFADTSGWTRANCNFTASNNILTVSPTAGSTQVWQGVDKAYATGRKFYVRCGIKSNVAKLARIRVSQNSPVGSHHNYEFNMVANTHMVVSNVFTLTTDISNARFSFFCGEAVSGDVFELDNFYAIDLTQMFGSGNEPTSVDQFTSLYPLPYYDYTLGKLLPFLGEELKTTNADETETNVLSLPTLTYFPSGMKSAGNIYDEITESKAITRIGSVDLGSLVWTYHTNSETFRAANIDNLKLRNNNLLCSIYDVALYTQSSANMADMTIKNSSDSSSNIIYVKNSSYTNATTFKNAMIGVYLYYELAAPTEENIPAASLVTEKGETPLYYDDELIADCNETISSESGIFDAKIKLMDDNTIYSQKIQLHVERKP